jgi:hypothetical protein
MNTETKQMKLAYWAGVIKESKTSGMKVSDWCASNQISLRKYYYWHKKVMHGTYALAVENGYLPNTDSERLPDRLPAAPDFAELPLPTDINASRISIMKNGFTIEVGPDFSEGGLLRVLKVMKNV